MAKRMKLFIPLVLMICMFTGCFGSSSNPSNPHVPSPKPEVEAEVYYLFIGVNDYPYLNQNTSEKDYTLYGCVNDAKEFYNKFLHSQRKISSVKSILLTSDKNFPESAPIQPTKENIKRAIDELVGKNSTASENSTFIFTFSGHGMRDELHREEYIVPYDAKYKNNDYDIDSLISDQELKEWVQNIRPNKCIFIIDSCYSAGMIKGKNDSSYYSKAIPLGSSNIMAKNLSEINNGKHIIAMSAADIKQESTDIRIEDEFTEEVLWAHGLFSALLIQGMSSYEELDRYINFFSMDYPADYELPYGKGNGTITVGEAFSYAKKHVEIYNSPYHQDPYIYYSHQGDQDTPLFYIP